MLSALIAKSLGLEVAYVELVARSASHRYKTYYIDKKRGEGKRQIDHPSKPLKLLQRWLCDALFSKLPVHSAVYSYRRKRSISSHARVHQHSNYHVRVDFRNFFGTITEEDIARLLRANAKLLPVTLSEKDISLVVSLVCKDGRLTIGAPSSPSLSNAALYEFDERMTTECKKRGITYSRYADDLVCSSRTPNNLRGIVSMVRECVRERAVPKLRINCDKTLHSSRKRRRVVTGVVITHDRKLSIGRQNKRVLRALVHRFSTQQLSPPEIQSLRGKLAHAQSIEPDFLDKLALKYGADVIQLLKTWAAPNSSSRTDP